MKNENYRICAKTIMDTTSDPDITFDENGVSNYVKLYEELIKLRVPTAYKAKEILDKTIVKIKEAGKNKDYDCLIGVSGGVDSTYVAWLTKELGLRPLAVHVDNGWNSELSVRNIENTLKKLEIDLYTEVLDWEEFKDIQLSFLKGSVPDGEIPTDHAIYATLYNCAAKFKIKYIISGTNIRTEGILPRSWARGHLDFKYIQGLQNKFGSVKIKKFPHLTLFKLIYFNLINRFKLVSLLDYVNYNKTEAIELLENRLGWIKYEGKHYESIYTRFFQGYILTRKFNIDKRRGHLSTLICSGQLKREVALNEIKLPTYLSSDLLKQDIEFVQKKFNLTTSEFEKIMIAPIKSIKDYPNNFELLEKMRSIYNSLKK
jgi:N-acetyl sugar amidotransferase